MLKVAVKPELAGPGKPKPIVLLDNARYVCFFIIVDLI